MNLRSPIPYDMFDLSRNAEEAKRFARCERIYHRGQELAWDGGDVLRMLVAQHGGVHVSAVHRDALNRVFSIILWGELAAWKISAQLADRLVPLEAKMAATSQAHDEARHFYTMHEYFKVLGVVPQRITGGPQALLSLVLGADDIAHKLVGMQLMVETIALSIFQAVRERQIEPVLCELLRYFERDEARHVALGVQYLPELLKRMTPLQVAKLTLFQVRLVAYAVWELTTLAAQVEVLGIEPRTLIELARRKQLAILQSAYESAGMDVDRLDNPLSRTLDAVMSYLFPRQGRHASTRVRLSEAWETLSHSNIERLGERELSVHSQHVIKTARGVYVGGEP